MIHEIRNSFAGGVEAAAHLRREVPVERILKAPIVADPLGLFDCCGVSDGAACAIVTTPEIAAELTDDPVHVKSLQIAVTSGEEGIRPS